MNVSIGRQSRMIILSLSSDQRQKKPYQLYASVAHQNVVVAGMEQKSSIAFGDHRQNLDQISDDSSNKSTEIDLFEKR